MWNTVPRWTPKSSRLAEASTSSGRFWSGSRPATSLYMRDCVPATTSSTEKLLRLIV